MKTVAALTMTLAAAAAVAADPPPGKQVFDRYCAECHAPGFGHPGTMQLEQTRGRALSVLEARKDLIPAYVATVVRNGLSEMPPYRPAEIDDATLGALVQYLAPGKPGAKRK
jgi:mono/diheme cytochrome c family protein